jgi:hypothetical protein
MFAGKRGALSFLIQNSIHSAIGRCPFFQIKNSRMLHLEDSTKGNMDTIIHPSFAVKRGKNPSIPSLTVFLDSQLTLVTSRSSIVDHSAVLRHHHPMVVPSEPPASFCQTNCQAWLVVKF